MTETSETKVCRLCACDSIDNKNIFDESEDLLIKLRTTFSLVIFKGDQLPQHLCNGCESVVVDYYDRIETYEKLEKKWLSETSGQNTIKNVLDAVEAESQKIRQTVTTLLPDYPINQKHNILAAVIKSCISPSSTDNFNVNGRSYLNTVLDYELPPVSTDEDQSKIDEDSLDASRFEMTRRVKKKKRRNPLRDYIRRGKRRKIAAVLMDPATNSTDANVEKSQTMESTANTQISNDSQCSDTSSPLRKKPGPKPKSKLSPNTDEAGGSLDKEFVHWKKPGPQAPPPIIENNRLRRSRRQFEQEGSKEEPGDAVKVKRSASKDKNSDNTRKVPQSSAECSVDVPKESEDKKEIEDEQRPTHTDVVSEDQSASTSSEVKTKIILLNPQEELKGSPEVGRPDSRTTKSNDSLSEDSDRPSSKNQKRLDESDAPGSSESKKKRQTSRINYSEALVDEALMYEEILMNQQVKEQLFIASTIESSKQKAKTVDLGKNNFSMDYDDSDTMVKKTKLDVSLENLGEICVSRKDKLPPKVATTDSVQKVETAASDVRLSEISITPIPKPKSAAVKTDSQINVSLKDIKKTFKTNPEMVFNINSAVSIQLKSAACTKSDQSQPSKGPSTTCQYCRKQFSDIKLLAVHQLTHLRIETHKIGSPLVLSPSFRRGRMVPMGNNKCFRCLNCWRLYPNSQSILQHWVTGKCIFYCSICGQSFHQNPKLIRDHFPEVHGIKFKMPNSSSAPPTPLVSDSLVLATQAAQRINRAKLQEQIIKGASASAVSSTAPSRSFSVIKMKPPIGRVKCHVCLCSFPNMQSRNSHMRLHKNDAHMRLQKTEKEPIKPINLRQLVSQPQRPMQINFNNIQQRQFPNANRIQPNQPIGAPNRQFRVVPPLSLQRAIKPADHQRPSQFNNQPSQQRTFSKPATFTVTENFGGSVKIKTESNSEPQYRSSDYQSNSDFSEYSELFQTETITEPTPSLTNFIKSEIQPDSGSGVPRLQVKKLHELQEPNYVNAQPISVNTFYTPTTIQPLVNTIPQYQLAAPLQLQVPQLQPIQPQFQIASVQHVQNTQYYNPVLVVSQPSQHTQEGYQYVPEQVDYSKYYS